MGTHLAPCRRMTNQMLCTAVVSLLAGSAVVACSEPKPRPITIGPLLGQSTAPGPNNPSVPPPDAAGVTAGGGEITGVGGYQGPITDVPAPSPSNTPNGNGGGQPPPGAPPPIAQPVAVPTAGAGPYGPGNGTGPATPAGPSTGSGPPPGNGNRNGSPPPSGNGGPPPTSQPPAPAPRGGTGGSSGSTPGGSGR
jgi:hypothetical protein